MMASNFRDEELVKVQGKQYPLVGGRLRLAHEGNKQLSISTSLISITDDRVIIQANIQTEKGSFSGLGNASARRDKMLANALVELAETRAIARALRFAGYGVEYTGFEEMPDDLKDNIEEKQGAVLASKAQLEAIASIAKHNNISSKQLHDIMLETTGKDRSRELTTEDVSKLMASLRNSERQANSRIS
jgi:hypothetical protein